MGFYDDLASDVDLVLQELGTTLILTQIQRAGYKPGAGAPISNTVTRLFFGVVVPKKQAYINSEHSVDIHKTELRAYLSGKDTTVIPAQGDRLTVGGRVYTIKSVDEISPAGRPVLYDCKVEL